MPITFEQFAALPEYEGRQELLEGEVLRSPPPKFEHDEVAHAIHAALSAPIHESGRWDGARRMAMIAVGYQLSRNPDSWLIPDVSVRYPDQKIENGYLQEAPMLAVEVVSESNTAAEIDRKTVRYLGAGAVEVWVVYPETRAVRIHTPDGGARRFTGIIETGIVPGAAIDLKAWWP